MSGYQKTRIETAMARRTSNAPPTSRPLFGHVAPLVYEVLQVMSLQVVKEVAGWPAKHLGDGADPDQSVFNRLVA